MKITDLNGYPIEVTDLNEAILITKRYMQDRYENKSYTDFDKRQNAYWTDTYEKPTAIKEREIPHWYKWVLRCGACSAVE